MSTPTAAANIGPSGALSAARTTFAALAAVATGWAIWLRDGAFDPVALALVAVALLSLAAAALVLLSMAAQFVRPPGIDLHPVPGGPWPFWGGLLVAIALAVAGMFPSPPLGRLRWPLLLATHAALVLWLLRASPSPAIDVFLFHRAGFAALLDGHSPYATTIPLLYGDARFYGEGLVRDGIVHVGHPYPPLSLALTFLAHFLCGDYRIALVAALTVSAACIAKLGRGRIGELCALLLLFSPRTFFVLEQGWTEPLMVAFVCALALAAPRAPRLSTWLLAGLIAVKQYGCFILPLLPLLFSEERRAQLAGRALRACALALLISLPLALFAPSDFVDSVLLFQLRQPFRFDALSFAALLARAGGPQLPGFTSFLVLAPALALGWRFSPRNVGGALAALAFAFAGFFDIGKQAFANYHFLVLALACAAAAALTPTPANERDAQSGDLALTDPQPAD